VLIVPRGLLAYQTPEGKIPFNEWLDELNDRNAVARVLARLARVRQGVFGDCKSAGDGVTELRVDYGPGYRVYFGQKGHMPVILLQRAKQYWKDYSPRE
jgi:putative addiction module killer protein